MPDDDTVWVATGHRSGNDDAKYHVDRGCPRLAEARNTRPATVSSLPHHSECGQCGSEGPPTPDDQDWGHYHALVEAADD